MHLAEADGCQGDEGHVEGVAPGPSFDEPVADRADRVRQRYYHKQEAFVREFGMPSCVGCGRCIENCPTGINVVEVFQYVRGDA